MGAFRSTPHFGADLPLTDLSQDRLAHKGIVEHWVRVVDHALDEGFVIGLYGGLGHGTSSVLNQVAAVLNQQPITEQEIVVRFNPWSFSGIEDLSKRLFLNLPASLIKRRDLPRRVRKPLKKLASLIAIVPFHGAQAGKVLR